jgi:hypothetical protein
MAITADTPDLNFPIPVNPFGDASFGKRVLSLGNG